MTDETKPGVPALLNVAQAAQYLGVSERAFHYMRTRAQVPPPVQLAPRVLRWARDDLDAAIAALPRQQTRAEPVNLLRGRIERAKRLGTLA